MKKKPIFTGYIKLNKVNVFDQLFESNEGRQEARCKRIKPKDDN